MYANFENFVQALEANGYKVTDQFVALQTYLSLNDRGNIKGLSAILMDGPPGTGKTYIAEVLSQMMLAEMVFFQFTPGVTREALLYDLDIAKIIQGMAGTVLPKDFADMLSLGILPAAIKASVSKPVILVLDELDKSHPSVDSFLLDFLQRGEINDPHLGRVTGNPKNMLVVITKNDERQLSEPLMRRLRRAYLQYPKSDVEIQMILDSVPGFPKSAASTLVTLANNLRKESKKGNLMKVPSTPELIRCAQDLIVVPEAFMGDIVRSWLIAYIEDASALKDNAKHLNGIFKDFLHSKSLS
jgi:MoxR-like ATPase